MLIRLYLSPIIALFLLSDAGAVERKGFSIEGGLLYDHPNAGAHNHPFTNMRGGNGYIANLGYDFVERIGLEIGVMHTTHEYELVKLGSSIWDDQAEKTTFFIKARGIPWRWRRLELVAKAGAGFFDVSGSRWRGPDIATVEVDFSGWGFTSDLDLRYHVTNGLAVTLYFGANFVNYNRFSQSGYRTSYAGRMPGGNSLNWGLTFFHRIGIPEL